MIKISGLTKTYAEGGRTSVDALLDVDLEIKAGEFVALTGPSGSGKTTLLFAIAGMITPSKGSVVVGERNLTTMSGAQRANFRANDLGFIFQMFHLIPYLTAHENVCVGALAQGVTGNQGRLLASNALERVGLQDRLKHLPGELSGGEQQRVSTARALVNSPAVLLADEPTGNLDSSRAQEIIDILKRENSQRNQTIIMATHNMEIAAQASRTISLLDGQVVVT
jgi:ABC-type lipoprotein export system ATPase subunit